MDAYNGYGDVRRGMPAGKVRAILAAENSKFPPYLVPLPRESWPMCGTPKGLTAIWRSRFFLVQVVREDTGYTRLSINRAAYDAKSGRWADGITWDQVQQIKREAGYGECWAVEVFPADAELVNVANVRHVFLLPEAPAFAWRRTARVQDNG